MTRERLGHVAEVAFWWACGVALVALAATSEALAHLLAVRQ